jgi:maltose alpha-D-glucosyltransferase/alpha-amylase
MTILEPPRAELAVPAGTPPDQEGINRTVGDWYKDAIIYQLHVKAFHDANGDGVGDFTGLMQRLDYIHDLGVTAIWLLPFYPSPLRDDGYDIADYRDVHPAYGDFAGFKAFLDEAHRRGIRVITELVINHTSDQHPWFQRARLAPPGSPERDYYVWSDTSDLYQGTRIIFLDTETSNWTWDATAGAFFWHRFYSHQPDLNFDNPLVYEEILDAMRFWLDLGVDGLRLDAVPYLCERDGTNNENLPETHEILRRIRSEVDARYPDRMLLAEANQWPEDTRPYFGEGDECHMAFHFPLMPRMYMGLAQEDRHPVTDILRQTPEVPTACQWALFLRNHDELTLEMVTDDERDYLWRTYAADSRARLNLGIRRRLAPLLENDRRKIELMNAMLLAMPGTPVLYYGDEIGMGDNYYLGDRDGVRTPMQWSADRNGGFSRADPQRLYLPPIMDTVYGYQSVNIEAQQRSSPSLLNWMRRMILVRKKHPAFGRGGLRLLYPRNRKVLAFVREHEDQRLLCVFNLARSAQAVELDLSEFHGSVPVELMGSSAFPPIGKLPYMLTLPGHGFYWFVLATEAQQPLWHVAPPEPAPDFITIVISSTIASALAGRERSHLERDALPGFLQRQRWFGGKGRDIAGITVHSIGTIDTEGAHQNPLGMIEVVLGDGEVQHYFLPFSVLWGSDHLRPGAPKLSFTVAKIRRGARVGAVLDAVYDEAFVRELVSLIAEPNAAGTTGSGLRPTIGRDLGTIGHDAMVRSVGAEQSNVSFIVDDRIMLKIYRRLRSGFQPELEVARFLTDVAGYENTPALLGGLDYVSADGEAFSLAAAFDYVANQGDAWQVVVEALDRALDVIALNPDDELSRAAHLYVFPIDIAGRLGQRTAELHRAFATPTEDPAFKPEPIAADDLFRWSTATRREAENAFAVLNSMKSTLPETSVEHIERILAGRERLLDYIDGLALLSADSMKTRHHGDFHLGQVLIAQDDVIIIDFEGEPSRSIEERRAKTSPLRDVAGMLRSFDYAASAALDSFASRTGSAPPRVVAAVTAWRDRAGRDFLSTYVAWAKGMSSYPQDPEVAAGLLDLFLLQKAFYEIAYEAANRPTWLSIPLRGVVDLLDRTETSK